MAAISVAIGGAVIGYLVGAQIGKKSKERLEKESLVATATFEEQASIQQSPRARSLNNIQVSSGSIPSFIPRSNDKSLSQCFGFKYIDLSGQHIPKNKPSIDEWILASYGVVSADIEEQRIVDPEVEIKRELTYNHELLGMVYIEQSHNESFIWITDANNPQDRITFKAPPDANIEDVAFYENEIYFSMNGKINPVLAVTFKT